MLIVVQQVTVPMSVITMHMCVYGTLEALLINLLLFNHLYIPPNLTFFAITKTCLSNSLFGNEILPSGFTIFCRDCGSWGGGVMLAIKDDVPSKLRTLYVTTWIRSSNCLDFVKVFLHLTQQFRHLNSSLLCRVIVFCQTSPNWYHH